MNKNSRIFIAGHKGLVGSAISRNLQNNGYSNLLTADKKDLDLTDANAVDKYFLENKIEYVFDAAAKVGGIKANNDHPAEFITQNIKIQTNLIESASKYKIKKFLFLGSSCIYPKFASQPIAEDQLLTGLLEETNEAYAIAKICGIKMCQAFRKQYGLNAISLMPTNLYGPGDNYHPQNSHVLPAMIRRFHEAKIKNLPEVTCWGDGSPKREFLYVDDLAEACLLCMLNYESKEIINIGTGRDITIRELAGTVAKAVGYEGEIKWDNTASINGTPRKVLNVNKIKSLGWEAKTDLPTGIKNTCEDFLLQNLKNPV
jgi:GDP-L-fucose synthase